MKSTEHVVVLIDNSLFIVTNTKAWHLIFVGHVEVFVDFQGDNRLTVRIREVMGTLIIWFWGVWTEFGIDNIFGIWLQLANRSICDVETYVGDVVREGSDDTATPRTTLQRQDKQIEADWGICSILRDEAGCITYYTHLTIGGGGRLKQKKQHPDNEMQTSWWHF